VPKIDVDRAIVRIEHADVAIDGVTVLHGIDWQLDPTRHWGIVGANGSGKTSFLELVAGKRWPAPNSGRRFYDFGNGRRTDAVEALQRITLVGPELQNRYARLDWNFTALDVALTGIFRTEIPRRAAGAADRARALEHLREAAAEHLAGRPFLELSRGEQRRVLIARALAFAPAVLVLDEPGSGLDAGARAALDEVIERISRSAQIVASAHTALDLPSVTTDLLELADGRIVRREALSTRTPSGEPRFRSRAPSPDRHATGEVVIEVRNANIWLGGTNAIVSLDWQLRRGEHWLVTGDNGAGKSSFLRLLHGQLRPAIGGSIAWPGFGNPRNVWTLRRNIGWVSPELQAAYRFPTSVFECVASGLRSSVGLVHRMSDTERDRTERLLEDFGLLALRDRKLATLSYGQMRCALIARTLVNQPALLLLDEPWEGLHDDTIRTITGVLEKAAGLGTQLVCVSHVGAMGLHFTNEIAFERGVARVRAIRACAGA
jgi:molybdate transport system ATP-binding protein